jgi:RNA polymerase sigma-70 factor (ECF subfamily)
MTVPADITTMLAAWKAGDQASLDRLVACLYPELRRIARQALGRRRAGNSVETVALASEAYLKLSAAGGIDCENRVHFLALCAQVMRRILVDHARRHRAARRGGDAVRLSLHDLQVTVPEAAPGTDLLALDEALEGLARHDPRKSRVVELRYFGGLTIEETAGVLGISVDTAKRDWRLARAWLFARLTAP